MRKLTLGLFLLIAALYVALHLVLGSSPVQKRVVAELQEVLKEYGILLQMESIEFSAFAPKVYLNRVRLETTPKAQVSLAEPLSVDKIKVRFRPLGLLFGRIAFDEIMLYHPRIQVPRADRLYKAVMGLMGSRGAIQVRRPKYDVLFYKVGVVDALFNIESMDPPFGVRSRSLTVIVEKGSGQRRSVIVQSDNLELNWDKLGLSLTKVDVDADLGSDSLRLNRGIIENSEFAVNLVGVSRLPDGVGNLPQTFNVSYDVSAKLSFLKSIPGLKAPDLGGTVATNGIARKDGNSLTGKGDVKYDDVTVDGYEIGSGALAFALDKEQVDLTRVALRYAGGEFKSSRLQIGLKEQFPVQGELVYQGLMLESLLKAVGVEEPPVAMGSGGRIQVSGTLNAPFELKAKMDSKIDDLYAVDDPKLPITQENSVVRFGDGTLNALLTFTLDKMDFDADIGVLGGALKGTGYVGFDDNSRVHAVGENISLTQIARIASLDVGGKARLEADVIVDAGDGHISGSFEVQDTRVADLQLGTVSGNAFYKQDLLTFENLVLPSLEPVRGNGYVDFEGKDTRYKFYVNARRAETDQIFEVLKDLNLAFEKPKGGEIGSRITVENGENGTGVIVTASGQGKNFQWFDERWVSSTFALTYRDSTLDLTRVMLAKPSGALEVRGRFGNGTRRLQLSTHGLEISNFEKFGNAPVSGQIVGQISFDGDRGQLFRKGQGELKLVRTKFRGVAVPDSTVRLRPDGDKLEYLFNLGGDKMRGRYVRSPSTKNDELLVYFQDYDLAPLMTLWFRRDIPPMSDLRATGDLSIGGDFAQFSSLKGSGTIADLAVGFKGTPMKTSKPSRIRMDEKGMRIDSLFLQGEDSELSLALNFEADRRLEGRLDGRIDLQYLQPFIPGLEYGSGKVSMGLRMSGHPDRYQLLGNVALESGTFRLDGFTDEFRAVEARLSVSQDRINVDRFEANVNGGALTMEGDVRLDRFESLVPSLRIRADKVVMRLQDYLSGKLSGEFTIRGKNRPYQLAGRCELLEGALTRFQSTASSSSTINGAKPVFAFDVQCLGSEKLVVATDIMQAEFRGNFHLVGDNVHVGLLGTADSLKGHVLFRDTRFNLDSASVKFESPSQIVPRFRVSGRANVREVRSSTAGQQAGGVQEVQNYEINLQVFGTPADYKIRLTSTPPLLEGEIISLLVLGVTSRGQGGDNFMDLGGALVGQIPFQSKLKNELGVNIKLSSQSQASLQQGASFGTGASAAGDVTAPTVQIQKEITDKTRLSYSNTLEAVPLKELRIEQMLDDNITVNATTMERSRGTSQPTQAYGLDFRYRFQFE